MLALIEGEGLRNRLTLDLVTVAEDFRFRPAAELLTCTRKCAFK